MSSGAKECYDEERDRVYNERLEKLKRWTPSEMTYKLDVIRRELANLSENAVMTRGQWASVSRIESILGEIYK